MRDSTFTRPVGPAVKLAKLLIVILLSGSVQAAEAWTWSPAGAHHAAVCLVTASQGQSQSSGSGCYVALGQLRGVLTARHCLGGQVSIRWSDGHTSGGEVTTDKNGADCGFIIATHPTIQPLTLSSTEPQPGEWLEFAGFGGPRNQLRHWWGRYAGVRGRDERGNPFADYSCAVMQGDSGGPIWNQRHEVVGVITVGGGNAFATIGVAQAFSSTGGPAYSVVCDFVARVGQRYGCGPSGCGPGAGGSSGGSSWAYPPAPSPTPSPIPTPPTPTPSPAPSVPCPGVIYQVDYERLASCLLPLRAADDKLRGADGPAGPTGPAGKCELTAEQTEQLYQRLYAVLISDPRFRGPPGQPGQPGQPDIAQLAAAVAAQLPPVRFQLLDEAGTVSQEQSKPLGEPIRLQLIPE